MNKKLRER